jgi:hypothetical protein
MAASSLLDRRERQNVSVIRMRQCAYDASARRPARLAPENWRRLVRSRTLVLISRWVMSALGRGRVAKRLHANRRKAPPLTKARSLA